MKGKTKVAVLVVVVSALATLGYAVVSRGTPTEPRSITIMGSTTVLPIVQPLAERWMSRHPSDTISVSGGGSGVGITSLIEGRCDIAMSSRAVRASENERAGGKLVEHKIALDVIAVVVHPNNPVNDLSIEQVKKIYRGEITNWSQVGGNNAPIVVYTRETTSGTYEVFHSLIMGGENLTQAALTVMSNGEMVQNVSANPNAIGYIGLGYLVPRVKALRINGVLPSESTALRGEYPVRRYLYLYTLGEPTGLAKEFIDFIRSPEGQQLVKEKGFIPLVQ